MSAVPNISDLIDQAVDMLKSGNCVAVPTETVYGLAADMTNAKAVDKIFEIKNRPKDHPLIIHIGSLGQLEHIVPKSILNHPSLKKLLQRFWPGPLTLVLPKLETISDQITGGQDTVAVRMPSHPIILELIHQLKKPIVAPSANKYESISPTSAQAVYEELGDELGKKLGMILDGGLCDVGIESTIVQLFNFNSNINSNSCDWKILRPGMVSEKDIEKILNSPQSFNIQNTPRVSGDKLKHYAPKTPTQICSTEFLLNQNFNQILNQKSVILAYSEQLQKKPDIICIKMPSEPIEYAHVLYSKLREADKLKADSILIESISDSDLKNNIQWAGVCDRIKRAGGSK